MDFLNICVIFEKCNEVVNLAFVSTFTLSFGRMHTPRSFFRSVRNVLSRSLVRACNVNRAMKNRLGFLVTDKKGIWV